MQQAWADQTTNVTTEAPEVEARSSFDVVAMGASLGGPAALGVLLKLLPPSFPAAVLVVQHRSRSSRLVDLLQHRCALDVCEAEDGQTVQGGVVYVAPPDRHLRVTEDRALRLSSDEKVEFVRPSVDVLFESVGRVYGRRAIGVVLTGSLADGANGVRSLKGNGGRVLVQDRATSAAFGMPRAALSTGCVDFMLPLESVAAALVTLVSVPGAAALFRTVPPPWAQL